ncbi:hypothetical protein SKAU_G00215880 [Synaphobranchus kaupii]|uniref:Uncharacterized protein n=1 Tax=Synaphobranchus kaupii TaxID=118154 RepID=A0A9Q1FAE2_SYNKA|nr:hypothetical protein SKAU_G00215880 [Synaphobranchus kaupii]
MPGVSWLTEGAPRCPRLDLSLLPTLNPVWVELQVKGCAASSVARAASVGSHLSASPTADDRQGAGSSCTASHVAAATHAVDSCAKHTSPSAAGCGYAHTLTSTLGFGLRGGWGS